jgi:hypothetical protein
MSGGRGIGVRLEGEERMTTEDVGVRGKAVDGTWLGRGGSESAF